MTLGQCFFVHRLGRVDINNVMVSAVNECLFSVFLYIVLVTAWTYTASCLQCSPLPPSISLQIPMLPAGLAVAPARV